MATCSSAQGRPRGEQCAAWAGHSVQHRDHLSRCDRAEGRERKKVEWQGWGDSPREAARWGKLGGLQAADVSAVVNLCKSDGGNLVDLTCPLAPVTSGHCTIRIPFMPHSCLKPMYACLCVCDMCSNEENPI